MRIFFKWGNDESPKLDHKNFPKIFPYPENFPPLVGRDFLQVCLRLDGNDPKNVRLDGNWQIPPTFEGIFHHFLFEGFPRS